LGSSTVNRMVAGSSPARGASVFNYLDEILNGQDRAAGRSVCAAYVQIGPNPAARPAIPPLGGQTNAGPSATAEPRSPLLHAGVKLAMGRDKTDPPKNFRQPPSRRNPRRGPSAIGTTANKPLISRAVMKQRSFVSGQNDSCLTALRCAFFASLVPGASPVSRRDRRWGADWATP
jgi:hypothetical protein